MKAYVNEDEILMLLNDVTIKDEELSDIELSELEKRKIHKDVLAKIKRNTSNKRKWLAAASLILICTTMYISVPTIAATTIEAINSFIFGSNKAIERAVENNYVQPINLKPAYSNGVEIKLTNIVMDKTTVALSFDLKFDNPKLLEGVQSVFLDLETRNEKNRILSGFESQNLGDKKMLGVISGGADNIEFINKENGELRYSFIINSDDAKIPEISKLKINIKSITLTRGPYSREQIAGRWSFETNVSDIFKNNESINFTAKNTESDISIKSVETTPTGTLIRAIVPEDIDLDVYNNIILIDEKADIQNSGQVASTGCSITTYFDNKNLYTMAFPITTFDNPNSLKLVIKNYKGKDIEIQLVRK